MDKRSQEIINLLKVKGSCSIKEIYENLDLGVSLATLKRDLSNLLSIFYIESKGKGKGTRYILSPIYELIEPIDLVNYYSKELDDREIKDSFNFTLIAKTLRNYNVLNDSELIELNSLHEIYLKNISELNETEYAKELERLAIDLSWKSSQIEGNTYSLLETERLLKEKETASGKSKEEAVMLLNHKDALDFIIENPDYLNPISVSKIEDIHSILVKELGVERNVRKRRVGISGTNYRPLDNEFQIKEALSNTCELINSKNNPFEKALLALVLISYIQPFMDGNKRTARIVSNAILVSEQHCPLSFRTIDSIEYKKAMLLFYEQNNISAFKEIFISQYEFAVKTYF
jgi:Fic family protein